MNVSLIAFSYSSVLERGSRRSSAARAGIAPLPTHDKIVVLSRLGEPSHDFISLTELFTSQRAPRPKAVRPATLKGGAICELLNQIPAGTEKWTAPDGTEKAAWKHFEEQCEEAISYIFEDQLHFWPAQVGSDDGMHRYDMLAKITHGEEAFWESLLMDFRTRYIVFEFKNYREPLGQNTIYVTEKYLFQTAVRSTAIIISRHGADANATIACRGALRDAAKLIINLTIRQVCDLL